MKKMALALGLGCLAVAGPGIGVVRGQVAPPFFNGAGSAFDPEIGIVNSGVLNDVQAVVSSDRKYVTLNMRPSNSRLLALREFTFQNGPALGTVGLANPAPSVLRQQGMVRVDLRRK